MNGRISLLEESHVSQLDPTPVGATPRHDLGSQQPEMTPDPFPRYRAQHREVRPDQIPRHRVQHREVTPDPIPRRPQYDIDDQEE